MESFASTLPLCVHGMLQGDRSKSSEMKYSISVHIILAGHLRNVKIKPNFTFPKNGSSYKILLLHGMKRISIRV